MSSGDYIPEHRSGEPLNTTLSNKTYDQLKFLAQILLPAVGALYFGLAQIWGLPKGEEVVGTIAVVDTFLGVVLGLSARQYKQVTEGPTVGFMNVFETEEGAKQLQLEFPGDPSNIDRHNKVTFKVRRNH